MTSSVFETPPPQLSVEEAQTAASDFYGISASAELLVSERDQNFLLCDRSGERYVLKIANPSEVRATLEMQNGAITHILEKESDLTIPRVRKNLAGEGICLLERNGDATFMVRLLDYIPGRFLNCCASSDDCLQEWIVLWKAIPTPAPSAPSRGM